MASLCLRRSSARDKSDNQESLVDHIVYAATQPVQRAVLSSVRLPASSATPETTLRFSSVAEVTGPEPETTTPTSLPTIIVGAGTPLQVSSAGLETSTPFSFPAPSPSPISTPSSDPAISPPKSSHTYIIITVIVIGVGLVVTVILGWATAYMRKRKRMRVAPSTEYLRRAAAQDSEGGASDGVGLASPVSPATSRWVAADSPTASARPILVQYAGAHTPEAVGGDKELEIAEVTRR